MCCFGFPQKAQEEKISDFSSRPWRNLPPTWARKHGDPQTSPQHADPHGFLAFLKRTTQEIHVDRRVVGWSAGLHVDRPCGGGKFHHGLLEKSLKKAAQRVRFGAGYPADVHADIPEDVRGKKTSVKPSNSLKKQAFGRGRP